MNTELIKQQIKELDTEDKIKDIFVYTLLPDNIDYYINIATFF